QWHNDTAIFESLQEQYRFQEKSFKLPTTLQYNDAFIYIQMQKCKYSLAKWLEDQKNQSASSRFLPRMKSWFQQI
ncbi:hypothetical protein PENTCL1PPCAC_3717, partial [Pristionchus entomophagus]